MKLHGLVDGLLELFGVDRLGQVLERAVLERLYRGLDGRRAGDEEHRNVEIALARGAKQLDAVHPRHRDVADDGVELHLSEKLGGLVPSLAVMTS